MNILDLLQIYRKCVFNFVNFSGKIWLEKILSNKKIPNNKRK